MSKCETDSKTCHNKKKPKLFTPFSTGLSYRELKHIIPHTYQHFFVLKIVQTCINYSTQRKNYRPSQNITISFKKSNLL